MSVVRQTSRGLIVRVRVQPRAAVDAVAGRHGDALRIRLTAPPVEGAANRACLKFLAKTLKVPVGALEIVAGGRSRDKQICYRAPETAAGPRSAEAVRRRIEALL